MTNALAIVGLQPAALAAPLKTYAKQYGKLDTLLFLATKPATNFKGTGDIAARIEAFAKRFARCVKIEEVEPSPVGEIASLEAKFELLLKNEEIVFFADPGPASLSAAIAHLLPGSSRVLHADETTMRVRLIDDDAGGEATELSDLGFDELLGLYKLSCCNPCPAQPAEGPDRKPLPSGVRANIRISGGKRDFRVDYAYERHGRLHVMLDLTGEDVELADDDTKRKSKAERRRSKIRQLAATKYRTVNGLQPLPAVLTKMNSVITRAKEHDIDGWRPAQFLDWYRGRVSLRTKHAGEAPGTCQWK